MAVLLRSVPRSRVPELLRRGWAWARELQPEPKPSAVLMKRQSRPGETWQEALEEMAT